MKASAIGEANENECNEQSEGKQAQLLKASEMNEVSAIIEVSATKRVR